MKKECTWTEKVVALACGELYDLRMRQDTLVHMLGCEECGLLYDEICKTLADNVIETIGDISNVNMEEMTKLDTFLIDELDTIQDQSLIMKSMLGRSLTPQEFKSLTEGTTFSKVVKLLINKSVESIKQTLLDNDCKISSILTK